MLQESMLSEYIRNNQVEWVPEMPIGIPPEDICVPTEHSLFRLTKEEQISEDDLVTYYEKDPNRDWGDKLSEAYAVSLFDNLDKIDRLKRIPSLKNCRGVAKICLNPADGVVKQTTMKRYHYSWWKTKSFDINSVETVMAL